ncbi:MAG: C10 family peptidase [Sedimentisphaerales bacterium]|nr:C10 family peptidase [Sedimentisphaerales bacterium]
MKSTFSPMKRWIAALMLCNLSIVSFSAPMGKQQARRMVQGWLKNRPQPFGCRLSRQAAEATTFSDAQDRPLYHVVALEPGGFLVVAADDRIEPIIAFVSDGSFDPSTDKPLGAILARDLPNRMASVREDGSSQVKSQNWIRKSVRHDRNQQRWDALLKAADFPEPPAETGQRLVNPSQIRVAPLVQSVWGQSTLGDYVGELSCYNYYTPPFATPGDTDNYPCGCVATSMAQLMRYHLYPQQGIGVHGFTIWIDGSPRTANTRGGDGSGGVYRWDRMVLDPYASHNTITLVQRQAIGALCYDAGVAVETEYTDNWAAASLRDASQRLIGTFLFANTIHGYNNTNSIASANLLRMINTNVDAALPVILGVDGPYGGHALLCDGYGYDDSTMYHHLNMGWSGMEDAWYALPNIDTDFHDYNVVDVCVYNIYPTGTGEIISGRITDPTGAPLANVDITVQGASYTARTDEQGIYALSRLPYNHSYTILPSRRGWAFTPRTVSTARSLNDTQTCGNVYGVDFVGQTEGAQVRFDQQQYMVGDLIGIQVINSELAGSGSCQVVVRSSAGDLEIITLTESTPDSGVFDGSIASSQSPYTTSSGTLEVWHSLTITANCPGYEETAEASIVGEKELIYWDDFEYGFGPEWWIEDGYDDGYTWDWYDALDDFGSGAIALVDSDSAGYVDMDESLILYLDCSGLVDTTLTFDHYFRYYYELPNEVADVDISINEGDWINVAQYIGQDDFGTEVLDISALVDGQTDVRIRWRYYNANWDYYWALDDIQVDAIVLPQTPWAYGNTYYAASDQTLTITLEAEDDGYPKNTLDYTLTSLPSHGDLRISGGEVIEQEDLPYTLDNGANQLEYVPFACYADLDEFIFLVDDGGQAPSGGVSNTATVTVGVSSIYHTYFETGLPAGWSIEDGDMDEQTWTWQDEGAYAMMIVDSDLAGKIWMDESLITTSIDCSNLEKVMLIYDHDFYYNEDEIGDVEVRVEGGPWQRVMRYQGVDDWALVKIDITQIAAGHSNLQVRWRYYNAFWEWYWAVFSFGILGVEHIYPGDMEGDCAVDFVDFIRFSQAWQATSAHPDWDGACDLALPYNVIDLYDLQVFADHWLGH